MPKIVHNINGHLILLLGVICVLTGTNDISSFSLCTFALPAVIQVAIGASTVAALSAYFALVVVTILLRRWMIRDALVQPGTGGGGAGQEK
jgi:hypothetical protein